MKEDHDFKFVLNHSLNKTNLGVKHKLVTRTIGAKRLVDRISEVEFFMPYMICYEYIIDLNKDRRR